MKKELLYPFDANYILAKKKRIKRELLAEGERFVDKKIAIFSFNYYNKKRHPVSSINLPDVFMRENQERSEHNGKPES